MSSTLPITAARLASLGGRSSIPVMVSLTSASRSSQHPARAMRLASLPIPLLQHRRHLSLSSSESVQRTYSAASGSLHTPKSHPMPQQHRTQDACRGRRWNSGQAGGPPPLGSGQGSESKNSSRNAHKEEPRRRTLRDAWRTTPIKWYPIPVLLGACVLVGIQARRLYLTEQNQRREGADGKVIDGNAKSVRLDGPWTLYVYAALPLNGMSRLWGWANNLTLPIWFRPFGFKLYARLFGCNLEEMKDPDLTHYESLGKFFYRELKDGARKPAEGADLISPADGKVLHFGEVKQRRVEQVKGITYSLDALLGLTSDPQATEQQRELQEQQLAGMSQKERDFLIKDEKQFANVNGIQYSLDRLIGGARRKPRFRPWSLTWWKDYIEDSIKELSPRVRVGPSEADEQMMIFSKKGKSRRSLLRRRLNGQGEAAAVLDDNSITTRPKAQPSQETSVPDKLVNRETGEVDRSDLEDDDDEDERVAEEAGIPTPDTPEVLGKYAEVALDMGGAALPPILEAHSPGHDGVREGNKLFFSVVYLAPGDYHRFHSPTSWIVERRRHFRGELYSVSPYVAQRLANLFVLNERVALLGRWRHGFFGMIPVGATNVGSIRINFDRDLRTNVRNQRRLAGTYSEATYSTASRILGGQPLKIGEEMGGFLLGSTIVLVFEAPEDFEFEINVGQQIKVGEAIGRVKGQQGKTRHTWKSRFFGNKDNNKPALT